MSTCFQIILYFIQIFKIRSVRRRIIIQLRDIADQCISEKLQKIVYSPTTLSLVICVGNSSLLFWRDKFKIYEKENIGYRIDFVGNSREHISNCSVFLRHPSNEGYN
jgi:hypothetical protein